MCGLQVARPWPPSGSRKDGELLRPLEASPTQFRGRAGGRQLPPRILAPRILFLMGVGRARGNLLGLSQLLLPQGPSWFSAPEVFDSQVVVSIKDSQAVEITIG